MRRRIDEVGTREPTIQRQGNDRILVQVPGEKDPDSIKRLLGQTAKLTFHLVDLETPVQQALSGNLPPGSQLLRGEDDASGRPAEYVVRKRVEVSGESLVDAQPTYYQISPWSASASTRWAGASSATSPAITSASCWRSCSTTR